jgi:hypothetical protein
MITSATTHLLRASTMTSFRLRYYVLGDDPDFCFSIPVLPEDYIMDLAQTIQKHYLGYTGVKLLSPKLFKINKSQDEIVNITAPTTECMDFGAQFEDYEGFSDLVSDVVHILVVARREWHCVSGAVCPACNLDSHISLNA